MSTIYEDFIEEVTFGKRFVIDFKKRNMHVGRNYLIKDGEWNLEKDLILFSEDVTPRLRTEWCLNVIENLYSQYLVSVPSERSESRRSYFYAKNQNELTDEEMICGERREVAQARLEGFILCAVLSGWLTWDEVQMGKWFWQSKIYKELVVLKEWITE